MLYWLDGVRPVQPRSCASLVGVVEDHELQLGARQGHVAEVVGSLRPVACRIDRGDCTTGLMVGPGEVALDHRGGGQVGQQPDRVEVEDELHVAVPLVPRGDRVAGDGVHVDVDAEQVVAPSVPWPSTSSTKYAPCSRLPCSRPCMSVKATTTVSISPRRSPLELVDGQVPVVAGHRCPSGRQSSSPRSSAAVSSQCCSIVRVLGQGAVEDGVDDHPVLGAGVLDVDLEHRDACSMS